MTKTQFIDLCKNFELGDKITFQKIIAKFSNIAPDHIKVLRYTGRSLGTIKRWLKGKTAPNLLLQSIIMVIIKIELSKLWIDYWPD
jgi:hypothetical protein